MSKDEVVLFDTMLIEESDNAEVVETVQVVEVEGVEQHAIETDSAFAALGTPNEQLKHALLNNRDDPDQHPIGAITGLKIELDRINALQTEYSNQLGMANYYEWNEGAYDEHGYFVSVVPKTTTIKICDGSEIFGVTVSDAGFIGGQDGVTLDHVNGIKTDPGVPRGNKYALVVTSGLVDVRCELNVEVGDYVISNGFGCAEKTESKGGYKVLARENKDGTEYAVIMLGVQADVTDALDKSLQFVDTRLDSAEINIAAAMSLANEAYSKAESVEALNNHTCSEVADALNKVDGVVSDVNDMKEQIGNMSIISAQAKAIAEGAANSAITLRDQAVKDANDALQSTVVLREDFKKMDDQITDIEDQITIVTQKVGEQGTAISGIRSEVDGYSAAIKTLTSWQGETNTSMARIEQKADANGASIQLLTTNLDKYSVGPYSQAYGFTLEQAASVLEEGMVYVPTPHADSDTHSEVYEYVEIGEDGKEVVKTFPDNDGYQFTPGYIYTWSDIDDSPNTTTMMWKESVGKVVEFKSAPSGTAYDFWYKNGGDNSDGYETDTLYKLDTYTYENGDTLIRWIAVATLQGNFSNRAVSQIRQDANSINLEVTNAKGDLAGIKAWAGEDFTAIQDTVSWKNSNSEAIATTIERASDAEAYIAQVASIKNEDGTIDATASIVAAINGADSSVGINADRIVMTGTTTFLKPGDLGENGTTTIHGGRIETGTIDANQIAANSITADKIKAGEINAGHIASHSITADQIDSTNLKVVAENVTGVLTIGQLPESVAENEDIPTKTSELTNDSGFQNASGVTTIIDDTVTTGYIEALNIHIKAGQIDDTLTIGQLPSTVAEKSDVPTDVSQLNNDSGFQTASEVTTIVGGVVTTDYVNALGLTAQKIHVIDDDDNTVFLADASQLPVMIGGFSVNADSLYNGKTTLQDKNDGVYIGTDGIGLGDTFVVTSEGKITATSGEIGSLTLIDKLFFGGDNQYYINANYNDSDYYLKLPGIQVDEKSGAVFSGNLSAPSGKIGGFDIGDSALSASDDAGSVHLGTDKIALGDTFEVTSDGKLTATDADIEGKITATEGEIGGCNIVDGVLYVTNANIAEKLTADKINADGIVANNVDISGTINATLGYIGGWEITESGLITENVGLISDPSSDVRFYAGVGYNTFQGSTINYSNGSPHGSYVTFTYHYYPSDDMPGIGDFTVTSVRFTIDALNTEIVPSIEYDYDNGLVTITAEAHRAYVTSISDWSLSCTVQYAGGYNTKILDDGTLYSKAADIEGKIKAEDGEIGGWNISENAIFKDSMYLYSSNSIVDRSLVRDDETSPIRLSIGNGASLEYTHIGYIPSEQFSISYDTGYTQVTNVSAVVTDCQDEQAELYVVDNGVSVVGGVISVNLAVGNTDSQWPAAGYQVLITYDTITSPFRVLEDGSLYARAAEIEGVIKATDGSIGGWQINSNALYYYYDADGTFSGMSPNGEYSQYAFFAGADDGYGHGAVFSVDIKGALYATNAHIVEGEIGGWILSANGTMRSSQSVYGVFKGVADDAYATNFDGLVYQEYEGYMFTVLTNTGIIYEIKYNDDYTSATKGTLRVITSMIRRNSGGDS